ncbi:MAG: PilW family protein [Ferrimonas sp.]
MDALIRNHHRIKWRQQQGMTLIELMLVLTLSLFVIGMVFTAVLADSSAYQASHATNQLVNKGRMSLHTLRLYLQQAGNREHEQVLNNVKPGPTTMTLGGFSWTWADGQVIQAQDDVSSGTALTGSDVVAIRLYGSDSENGEVYRCTGETLGSEQLMTLLFYVSDAFELICLDDVDNSAVVFEESIEQMQLDFVENNASQYGYVSANNVSDWANIGHFRIALLVARAMKGAPLATSQRYDLLGTEITVGTQLGADRSDTVGMVRQVVRDNITLPNNRSY